MSTLETREAQFHRIYRFSVALWYAMSAIMTVVYAAKADMYHLGISLGTLIVPPFIALFHRLFRLRPSWQLNTLVLGFIFISYPLGSCVDFYRIVPHFDKLAHTLSGVFVSVLCIVLYCALAPAHRIGPRDMYLALAFTFFGSMAVAGMWELGEYAVSAIVKMDLQRVAATGVSDSMNDMLVCMAGTIAALPAVVRLAKDRRGVLTSPVRAFVEYNFPKES